MKSRELKSTGVTKRKYRDKKESMEEVVELVEELVKPRSKYLDGPGSCIKKGKGWQSIE